MGRRDPLLRVHAGLPVVPAPNLRELGPVQMFRRDDGILHEGKKCRESVKSKVQLRVDILPV